MSFGQRGWVNDAITRLEAEATHRAETPLLGFPLPAEWGIRIYLKDESRHPTGSLKHRLAHSLLLHALANGDIIEGTSLVEASSGSTAVSEAYFARMLGLAFVAVIPASTSQAKIALIEEYGGRCELVGDASAACAEAERLGDQPGWHYLDQFANASIATDWRGTTSIAHSIFDQLKTEPVTEPTWIVVGAGTGGTSATIGRYCRLRQTQTRLAVVDPEGSVFHQAWLENRRDVIAPGSRIEGIGRPRVEQSFVPGVIDDVLPIPDAGSVAAMQLLFDETGLRAGASTGTNLYGSLQIASRMRAAGETGSIVTLLCDSGERYLDSYHSAEWLRTQGLDPAAYSAALRGFLSTGTWAMPPADRPDHGEIRPGENPLITPKTTKAITAE